MNLMKIMMVAIATTASITTAIASSVGPVQRIHHKQQIQTNVLTNHDNSTPSLTQDQKPKRIRQAKLESKLEWMIIK